MPRLTNTNPVPAHSIVRCIPGYIPLCLFARGGMADVFLARCQEQPTRLVVIKTLRTRYLDDPECLAMFGDEMRISGLLRHPNIVDLVEAGSIEGEPYLILELIEGISLSELAERQRDLGEPLAPALVISIILGAARGLQYMHELRDERGMPLQIIHRDLNPQNLIIDQRGVTKLIDFGIAKAVGQRHQSIGCGVKGKMAYAAPEYVRGHPPDQRVDIFSLGVVMGELLWNRRLFRRPTAVGTMQAVVYDEPAPPPRDGDDPAARLDELVSRAIAKEPAVRIGSARELVEQLETAVAMLGGERSPAEIAAALALDKQRKGSQRL
jgi:eukaryotic-like serine/threonine-protein kinase